MIEHLPRWDTDDVESLRRFSKIGLIVVDLDGTVLPSEFSKLEKTIKILKDSLNRRYYVDLTIATGRALKSVKPQLDKLPVSKKLGVRLPLILYNGSLVVRSSKSKSGDELFDILYQKKISSASLRHVLEISSIYGARSLAYFYEDPYFRFGSQNEQEYVLGWSTFRGLEREFNGLLVQWQSTYTIDENLTPLAILIDTSEDIETASIIEEKLAKFDDISLTRSGQRYIEVRPKGSNKGVALEFVARKYNYPKTRFKKGERNVTV